MKKFSLFLLVMIAFACKKKDEMVQDQPPPDSQGGLPKVEAIGVMTTVENLSGICVRWGYDKQPDPKFIANNHTKVYIHGTHYLETVGANNIVYFGTEIIDGFARIVAFTFEGKKLLSQVVGLPLMSDRHENLYAFHADKEGNMYILAHSETMRYRKVTYVYKITKLLEISKIDMPNDISFALFKTTKGLVALKTERLLNELILTVGFDNGIRWMPAINMSGYNNIETVAAYQNDANKIILIIKAVDVQSKEHTYLMYFIDILTEVITKHKLKLDNKAYSFGKGLMEGNILHLPASESNSSKVFTLRIDTQTDVGEIPVVRTDLSVESGTTFAQALFIKKMDGGYYVGGTQQEKACYWLNGKLNKLATNTAVRRSYPIDLFAYRN